MRSTTKQALLTLLLPAITVLAIYVWLMHRQGLSIEPIALESRGREIWATLRQLDEPSRQQFTARDTPWIIAKNLPEDIPGHFIVMATANVDAETLRARLSADDMDKRITVTFDSPIRALREHAFLIREDGRTIRFSKRRTPPGKYTCREVYDNIPFDITTNPANRLPVKYLTPDGEKAPGQ